LFIKQQGQKTLRRKRRGIKPSEIKRAKGSSDNVTVQWIKTTPVTPPSIMQRLFSTLLPKK